MAVRAIVEISDIDFGHNENDMILYLKIQGLGGYEIVDLPTDPIPVEESDIVINAQVKEFVKNYCINIWQMIFRTEDTVRLIHRIDAL